MRIAMIGSRGFNSNYGGIERVLGELCPRLTNLGCDIHVYSRSDVAPVAMAGLKAIPTRALGGKHFENITRSAIATIKALGRYDVIHYHAIGPGMLSAVTAVAGQPSVVTVHGLDYRRDKWGRLAKTALHLAEKTLVHCADDITVVSQGLVRHFKERRRRTVIYIPNGFTVQPRIPPGQFLRSLGLMPGYLLYASRLTSEKACHELIEVFNRVQTSRRLVIAGGSVSSGYLAMLKRIADPDKIVFVGHRTECELAELFSNAYLHVLPSYIEGMSMALIEAFAHQVPSLLSDIEENREVAGDKGFYFKVGNLPDLERSLVQLTQEEEQVAAMAASLQNVAMESWDDVAALYYRLYRATVN